MPTKVKHDSRQNTNEALLPTGAPGESSHCIPCTHSLLRNLCRLKDLGLVLLLIVYSIVGACVFLILEGSASQEVENLDSKIGNFCVEHQMESSYNSCVSLIMNYSRHMNNRNGDTASEWNIYSALVYSATVYTTIGYGHMYPSTVWGKVFTMLYAACGIPILFGVLARLGYLFCLFLHKIWSKARALLCGYVELHSKEYLELAVEERDFPFSLALTITVGWLLIASAIISAFEQDRQEWNFFNAFYFCFISVTTIGLGDMIPRDHRIMVVDLLVILIGLSLLSMCINLVQTKLELMTKEVLEKIELKYKNSQLSHQGSLNMDQADAEQEIEKLLSGEHGHSRWMKNLIRSEKRKFLIEEWRKRANMKTHCVQASIAMLTKETQMEHCQSVDVGIQLSTKRRPAPENLPLMETKISSKFDNHTDDFSHKIHQVNMLLHDCRILLSPTSENAPKPRSHSVEAYAD